MTKAEVVHFSPSLLLPPAFRGHAIGGDHHSGAVIAITAMHKNFFARILTQQSKKSRKDFIFGTHAMPWQRHKSHSGISDGLLLPLLAAQTNVDNAINAHL